MGSPVNVAVRSHVPNGQYSCQAHRTTTSMSNRISTNISSAMKQLDHLSCTEQSSAQFHSGRNRHPKTMQLTFVTFDHMLDPFHT